MQDDLIFFYGNFPRDDGDVLEGFFPDLQGGAIEYFGFPRAVHGGNSDVAERHPFLPQEDVESGGREHADGLPAKQQTVAAVRKALPMHFANADKRAGNEIGRYFLEAVQGADNIARPHREEPRRPQHEPDRRTLDKVAVSLDILHAEKGIDGGEHSPEGEREHEEENFGIKIRLFRPAGDGEKRQHRAAEELYKIRGDDGQTKERKDDRLRRPHRRGEKEIYNALPSPRRHEREGQQECVEQKIFHEGVFPIDGHLQPQTKL